MKTKFVVYGGSGHRRLRSLPTLQEANDYAAEFEAYCYNRGVLVPRSIIREEEA